MAFAGVRLAWAGWAGQQEAAAAYAEFHRDAVKATFADGNTRGRILFPTQGKAYFVIEGATKKNLRRGPVHIAESVMPGEAGNSIIAAHRDTHFRVLKDVKKGQEIGIEERGRVFLYRVTETKVIEPDDNYYYLPTSRAVITLVTCYPFYFIGAAPQRYIVRAELVGFRG